MASEPTETPRRPCGGPWDALWAAAKLKAGLVISVCPDSVDKKTLAKDSSQEYGRSS